MDVQSSPPTIAYDPAFLPAGEAKTLLSTLLAHPGWRQPLLQIYGRAVPIPRRTCWIGDPECSYTYSGLVNVPGRWTPELAALRDRINQRVPPERAFNAVLLNHYRSGADSVSWHADNERELGHNPLVASISVGDVRTFSLRNRATKRTYRLPLASGSLLLMLDRVQIDYEHAVLKEKSGGDRVNLTFRRIVPPGERRKGAREPTPGAA